MSNEKAIYELIINGEHAMSTLKELQTAQRQLIAQFKNTGDETTQKKVAQAWQLVNDKIVAQNNLLKGNSSAVAGSVKAMEYNLQALKKSWQETGDAAERAQLGKQIKTASLELEKHNKAISTTSGLWGTLKNEAKAFGLMAASYLGVQYIFGQVQNLIGQNAQLSDSLSDIEQTTNLSTTQVKKLNKELTQIDTRTPTKDLREMAVAAGQLGVAEKDVQKFVVATDKLNVVMGKDFGGNAEELTNVLGKMRNVLSDIKSDQIDQDMLHIGNALYDLGKAGLATAPVVADFANRIGGVGIPLGLSSAQVLGLSASLQELNVSTERGGTAITKILQKMTTNVKDFAQIANLDLTVFTNMLNTDLYGAFKQVIKGSQDTGISATALANVMKDAELQGSGASEVFLKLSKNIGMMDEKVKLSGESLAQTDSIMEGFNRKNNNMAADLAKIGKAISGMFINSNVVEGAQGLVHWLSTVMDKASDLDDMVEGVRNLKSQISDLETGISPLLDRYDDLKAKTTLSKDEQEELKKILVQVTEQVPIAVSEFDKYGNALSINTGKARDFILAQKTLLVFKNRDAIKEAENEIKHFAKLVEGGSNALNNYQKQGFKIVTDARGISETQVKLTNADFVEMVAKIEQYKELLEGARLKLKELKGEPLVDAPKPTVGTAATGTPTIVKTPEEIKVEEELRKRLLQSQEQYHKQVDQMNRESRELRIQAIKEDGEREQAELRNKYDNQVAEEKSKLSEILKIEGISKQQREAAEQAHADILLQLWNKYADDRTKLLENGDKARAEKEMNQDLQNLKDQQQLEELELAKQRAQGIISEEQYNHALNDLHLKFLTLKLKNLADYASRTPAAQKQLLEAEKQMQDLLIKIHDQGLQEIERRFKKSTEHLSKEQKQRLAVLLAQLQVAFALGGEAAGESTEKILAKIKKLFNEKSDERPQFFKDMEQWLNDAIPMVQQFADSVSRIWASQNRIRDNQDRIQLERTKNNLNKEKGLWDRYLKNKVISKTEHDKHIKALDDQADAQERKIKREAAIRNQKSAIFQATVSALMGITQVIAAYGWPMGVIFGALQGLALFKEIQAIKSEPLPELGDGGRFSGIGKHPVSKQEVQDPAGRRYLVEDNETLLSSDTRMYNQAIVDELLWASKNNGGKMRLPYIRDSYPQPNFSRITETARLEKSSSNWTSPKSPTNPFKGKSEAIVNQSPSQSNARQGNNDTNSTLLLLHAAVEKLHKKLDEGIEAKMEYRTFKKDVSRLDKITGGNPV